MNGAWVVGECCNGETADDWKNMIQKSHVPKDSIFIIDLNKL
jgi:hypothetical protein